MFLAVILCWLRGWGTSFLMQLGWLPNCATTIAAVRNAVIVRIRSIQKLSYSVISNCPLFVMSKVLKVGNVPWCSRVWRDCIRWLCCLRAEESLCVISFLHSTVITEMEAWRWLCRRCSHWWKISWTVWRKKALPARLCSTVWSRW